MAITPQVGEQIFSVPWGHHKLLIDKCKGQPDKAIFYVQQTIANGWSRDNKTIGLLICKTKDNIFAQYALEATNQPLGISEYELQKLYPTQIEGTMPSIEEIENELNNTK